MAQTHCIEIPLPPVHCKPNSYCHWRTRGAAAKQYREEAYYRTLEQCRYAKMKTPVRVAATFYMARKHGDARYRPRDVGNAVSSLKAAIDGIVDAALIPDDNHKYLLWGNVKLLTNKASHEGRSCVVLTFTEEPK